METQLAVGANTRRESITIPIRYVLYARKSTEQDEKQALSIESQVKEMLQIAERENLNIIDIRREAHSAKDSGKRPVFEEILADLRGGRFNGIIVWHPDRLSRNAGDLGSLVDLMDQKLLTEIRTYGQTFTNTPSEKFLLMILCSQAKLENDNKSINVKRGLRTRCEMGLWPAPAPTGYLNEKRSDRKGYVYIDQKSGHIIKQMFEKVGYEKWSGRKVYHWLKFELNFKTTTGNKSLSLGNIFRILENPFYYGRFEYPRSSGNWYDGAHEPLISKELYDAVQQQLKGNTLKTRQEKEFAFTRLIKCGLCGSGITADEKYKKLKDGTVRSHVYYGCTKVRDRNCKCGYMKEADLISQLQLLLDSLELKEGIIKKQLDLETQRYMQFQSYLLGEKSTISTKSISSKEYAKFILEYGTNEEKRNIFYALDTELVISEGKMLKALQI